MAKRRPNNTGSIQPYRNGFRGQYYDPVARQQRAIYAKTRKECQAKLDEKISAIKAGTYCAPDKMTVEQWLQTWFSDFYAPSVAPSTAATTLDNIRQLNKGLGTIPLQKLDTIQIQRFINASDSKSHGTLKRYRTVLHGACNKAVTLHIIKRDPTIGVELPHKPKKEIQFLTQDEQAAILPHIPETTQGRALKFMLGTGLRAEELCGLQWQDVKPDGLHIARTHSTIKDFRSGRYEAHVGEPKTQAGTRIIPLTAKLRDILNRQSSAQKADRLKAGAAWLGEEPHKDGSYIFSNAVGRPADRHNLNRAFVRVLDAAGLPHRSVHTLRHTFASNWIRAGNDVVALSRILGHTDAAFTYKVYCHADSRSLQEGMNVMDGLLR